MEGDGDALECLLAVVQDLLTELSKKEIAQELKTSCTNVIVQCYNPQTRCIFLWGTIIKVDSRIASEIL